MDSEIEKLYSRSILTDKQAEELLRQCGLNKGTARTLGPIVSEGIEILVNIGIQKTIKSLTRALGR